MNIPNIVSIQRYSIHDGDGIRTTVFFKGCSLNCWWCHNPESQSFKKEVMYNREKCSSCFACTKVCDCNVADVENSKVNYNRSKCTQCEKCLDYCINNAREVVGKEYSVMELVKEIDKDSMFYESSFGGVTLSGGEVMLQDSDYMVELVKKLNKRGYNIAMDTCGYAPEINYEKVLPYVDTFLYDIKLIDNEKHKKYMGKGNELIFSNLEFINKNGANIYIRIPVIGGVNDSDKDIEEIIDYLKEKISVKQVNLLPYHDIASSKYDRLDLVYPGKDFTVPTKERMEELKDKFIKNGFNNTKIGG
ncbi:MAG: glycyl-radical enzyme activating protein [Terrisporobacter sp.]|uniref:trans-4-hydroxy-L-proline dehydratase activase n=1 Tax=Terrisporobacter sp. TaxID=1965305 RepID=UPI002FCBE816